MHNTNFNTQRNVTHNLVSAPVLVSFPYVTVTRLPLSFSLRTAYTPTNQPNNQPNIEKIYRSASHFIYFIRAICLHIMSVSLSLRGRLFAQKPSQRLLGFDDISSTYVFIKHVPRSEQPRTQIIYYITIHNILI